MSGFPWACVFLLLLGCWDCTADAAVEWLWTLCLMLHLPCCDLGICRVFGGSHPTGHWALGLGQDHQGGLG